ncbi:MAG: winged helix-turn-helix transcriptional regulator [Actinobacteria bacterium]|jgi:predicted nucleotidyltransferase/biotin operon repressor|nr:MAG: winged helix-turn-helix transcriptional regulator [Actinomycetota bacterium]
MRFHEPLDDILGNRTQVRLLRLLSRTRSAHTGRELARLIGQSHNTTRYALEELERHGLVVKQQAGRSNMYSLDQDNIIFTRVLSPAFELEEDLLGEVASIFSDEIGQDLLAIILFGSVARGEEIPNSDLDLVLVFSDEVDLSVKEDDVSEASLRVAKHFGNQVSAVSVTSSEYERKKNARRGLWREIAETGILIGP